MIPYAPAIRALLMICGLALGAAPVIAQEQASGPPHPGGYNAAHPLNDAVELGMKVKESFTVAVGGDLNYRFPINQSSDPAVQSILKVLRDADLTVGNLEGYLVDFRDPAGWIAGLPRGPEIAADMRDMGFDILARANNHTLLGGPEQMLETGKLLDEVGVRYAGVGRDLIEARSAQFVELPKGRVGMVAMTTNLYAGGKATPRYGMYGGMPGQNILDLTEYRIVNREQLDALRQIRDSVYEHRNDVDTPVPPIAANERKDRLQLLQGGPRFKLGDQPGGLSFEMNDGDLRDILRNVRNGKQMSDYMTTTIHTHEDDNALWLQFWGNRPTDFEVELAHKAVDAGSDLFFATGSHVLRGIEIYKGRPVFYGMSATIYTLQLFPPGLNGYLAKGLNPFTTEKTDLEVSWDGWDRPERPRLSGANMDGFVAELKYEGGKLKTIILHPLSLGVDLPKSQMGVPRLPAPAEAERILRHLQRLSSPFGTKISIENGLGIIRVSS